ncbi:tigger transposable element-derived protein 4-like [Saccostrea cucullata]|uniref:tigger transposable element-derived protein 4-like n=1 Tax=Saccostrea cuccullata TaxID=36930 RepID=UPI002ED5336A
MIVDNCPAHPKVDGLKAIRLFFLPPNTTSKTQPMDQGIIQNLKVHYRKQVILKQLQSIEKKTELQISVLDALRMLNNAWNKVTEKTIKNCFRHAKFVINEPENTPDEEEEDPEDDIPLAALRLRVPFEDYAQVDENVNTAESTTDADIVESIKATKNEEKEESEEENEPEPPKKKPPTPEVRAAYELIQTWAEMSDNAEDLFPGLQKIDRRLVIEEHRSSSMLQQSCITQFFGDSDSDRNM